MLINIISASFGSRISFHLMAYCHLFCHHYSPHQTPPPSPPHPHPPLSMDLWEKAPEEGLGLVNGGQLHQLLHPNEAALSFTKPQLITLQVISKQDCLQLLISAARPLFTHNQQDGDETRGRGGQKPCCFTLIIGLMPMIGMALTRLKRGGNGVDTIGAGWAGFTIRQLGKTH